MAGKQTRPRERLWPSVWGAGGARGSVGVRPSPGLSSLRACETPFLPGSVRQWEGWWKSDGFKLGVLSGVEPFIHSFIHSAFGF